MTRQLNEEEQMNHWLQEAYHKALRNGETDPRHLNVVHDQVIEQVVHTAFEKVKREKGSPPSPFVFFLMGSAGREEPTVGSDQDHESQLRKSGRSTETARSISSADPWM
jgi:CBS domain-containing protein